jgi:3-(methylthio)propanoyl-CoA dehydrogenase
MLLTMKAYVDAMRALLYVNAEAIDRARHEPDEPSAPPGLRAGSTCSSRCPRRGAPTSDRVVTSLGIQVHGGMGYIEETGVAQHYRDARITAIYEGTNGIQAMDLVGRKLPMRADASTPTG